MTIQENYDLIVIGCGFCGSVIARLAAEECDQRVLVLERRSHIAGNMYDEWDKNGFLVQKYGPHVFHTNEEKVYRFINRFAAWKPYKLLYGVNLDGRCIPAPFGFRAIRMMYPASEAGELIASLQKHFPGRESAPVLELLDCKNYRIAEFANMLYQKNYQPYAAKQWNLDPTELDQSVIARMPIIFSERENYFTDQYEVLPVNGFTDFFRNLLAHDRIDIRLGMDALECLKFDFESGVCRDRNDKILTMPIVYTGALEDLFRSPEPLPYRSLYFEYQTMDQESYQPVALVTYPQTQEYLRTTEFSKLTGYSNPDKTVVSFEYSVPYDKGSVRGNEPYYPILTERNIKRNNDYLRTISAIKNIVPCGRLADYKYYNMDQAVIRAFEIFGRLRECYWGCK